MDDFAKIYLNLDELNKKIYGLEEEKLHHREEPSKMAKIIDFNIYYNSGKLTVTKLTSDNISQYQRVIIRANLIDFPAVDSYAVRFHISSPSYATLTEEKPEDFQFSNYMSPEAGSKNSFLVNLTNILGKELKIGAQNACPLMFEIYDGGSSDYTDVSGILLYKTNVSQTYSSDDLTAIFIKLNELNERIHELEAM